MQKIMETEQLSGISGLHQQKKTIREWRASKEELKKIQLLSAAAAADVQCGSHTVKEIL
jgi:hypothetical protein